MNSTPESILIYLESHRQMIRGAVRAGVAAKLPLAWWEKEWSTLLDLETRRLCVEGAFR